AGAFGGGLDGADEGAGAAGGEFVGFGEVALVRDADVAAEAEADVEARDDAAEVLEEAHAVGAELGAALGEEAFGGEADDDAAAVLQGLDADVLVPQE